MIGHWIVFQEGRPFCSDCGRPLVMMNPEWGGTFLCPIHGTTFARSKTGAVQMAIARDPQKYTLTLLEMPEGSLKTIATLAGLTGKPSWLLREQFLEGQWIFPEPLLAQQVLDWMPKLKQRGLPFKIAPDFPWLDGVPDPETPPPF